MSGSTQLICTVMVSQSDLVQSIVIKTSECFYKLIWQLPKAMGEHLQNKSSVCFKDVRNQNKCSDAVYLFSYLLFSYTL